MKRWIILGILFLLLLFPMTIQAEEKEITLYFFHGQGCPHCAEEEVFLNAIDENYPSLKIVRYEVWSNEENSALLDEVQETMEIKR